MPLSDQTAGRSLRIAAVSVRIIGRSDSLYADKIGKIVLIGFLISLSVEIVQMFGCGATDINDLITNTVGACLGFCVYKALHKIIPKSWLEKIQVDGVQCVFELAIFWICTLLIMITIQPQIYHALFNASRTGGDMQIWN